MCHGRRLVLTRRTVTRDRRRCSRCAGRSGSTGTSITRSPSSRPKTDRTPDPNASATSAEVVEDATVRTAAGRRSVEATTTSTSEPSAPGDGVDQRAQVGRRQKRAGHTRRSAHHCTSVAPAPAAPDTIPPAGPAPGCGVRDAEAARRPSGSARRPRTTTGSASGVPQRAATRSAIGIAVDLDERLVACPSGVLDPPVSTAPAILDATLRSVAAGIPDGSSCSRNRWHRSASSVSPIACGHLAEPAQRAQEAAVRRLGPAHVATPPPSVGPQRVEATVVADPVGGVALDRVATEIAELAHASRKREMPPPLRRRRRGARRPAASGRLPDVERPPASGAGSTVVGRPVDMWIWLVAHDGQRTDPAAGRAAPRHRRRVTAN